MACRSARLFPLRAGSNSFLFDLGLAFSFDRPKVSTMINTLTAAQVFINDYLPIKVALIGTDSASKSDGLKNFLDLIAASSDRCALSLIYLYCKLI
jgi:hypothetical protein